MIGGVCTQVICHLGDCGGENHADRGQAGKNRHVGDCGGENHAIYEIVVDRTIQTLVRLVRIAM